MDKIMRLRKMVNQGTEALHRMMFSGYGPCSGRYRRRWKLLMKHKRRLVSALREVG